MTHINWTCLFMIQPCLLIRFMSAHVSPFSPCTLFHILYLRLTTLLARFIQSLKWVITMLIFFLNSSFCTSAALYFPFERSIFRWHDVTSLSCLFFYFFLSFLSSQWSSLYLVSFSFPTAISALSWLTPRCWHNTAKYSLITSHSFSCYKNTHILS